jgi:hypothetical protein
VVTGQAFQDVEQVLEGRQFVDGGEVFGHGGLLGGRWGCELLRSPDSLDCAITTIPASNAGGIELGVAGMAVSTGGAWAVGGGALGGMRLFL